MTHSRRHGRDVSIFFFFLGGGGTVIDLRTKPTKLQCDFPDKSAKKTARGGCVNACIV